MSLGIEDQRYSILKDKKNAIMPVLVEGGTASGKGWGILVASVFLQSLAVFSKHYTTTIIFYSYFLLIILVWCFSLPKYHLVRLMGLDNSQAMDRPVLPGWIWLSGDERLKHILAESRGRTRWCHHSHFIYHVLFINTNCLTLSKPDTEFTEPARRRGQGRVSGKRIV